MDETTASDVRARMRQAADEYLDTALEDGDLSTCAYTLAAGFRDLDAGTVTTGDGLPAFTEDAPAPTALLAAAHAAIPALELLGDFIGSTWRPGRHSWFDRAAVVLTLKTAIARAATLPYPRPAGQAAGPSGQCSACHAAEVPLPAALAADNCKQLVCADCHRSPRIPTVTLAALGDSRPVYVLARGDITRLAGREVTDEEAERVTWALGYSTLQEAVNGAVEQVCGFPEEHDPGAEDD